MYKILIAEEDAAERNELRTLLERSLEAEYTILEAETGDAAVRLWEQARPQLLLLQVELPGMSGLEAARQIRGQGGSCAIVFLSARDDFACAREAISLRALNYLLKPCAPEELMGAVGEAVRLFSLEQPGRNSPRVRSAAAPAEEENGSIRLEYIRQRIEACIRENYHTNLTLQKTAQVMNYSSAHFCRLFKQCFHVNFSAYLTAYRVERARELLRDTMQTVKEVAAACGYTDTSYFIRVFKGLTGMTPGEYRITTEEDRKKVP